MCCKWNTVVLELTLEEIMFSYVWIAFFAWLAVGWKPFLVSFFSLLNFFCKDEITKTYWVIFVSSAILNKNISDEKIMSLNFCQVIHLFFNTRFQLSHWLMKRLSQTSWNGNLVTQSMISLWMKGELLA